MSTDQGPIEDPFSYGNDLVTRPPRQYEFDEHENNTFSDLSLTMKTAGWALISDRS